MSGKLPQLPKLESYCSGCEQNHTLDSDTCQEAVFSLMERLESLGHINLQSPHNSDPLLSTDHLFGQARGKMFGVLVGKRQDGSSATLYAFSGQYNGHWIIPGWAPPLFDAEKWHAINQPAEEHIKMLGRRLKASEHGSQQYSELKKLGKQHSQDLMRRLHDLYSLKNFHGQTASLSHFFKHQRGIPTGAGDCCAPKLLNHAVKNQIQPEGLVEFYWGLENRSKTKNHTHFYAPCKEKCGPLLGFLLCGSNNEQLLKVKKQ